MRRFALTAVGAMMICATCPLRSADKTNAITIAVGPLTGSAAARGKDLEQAARMAVDEANAAGGINGAASSSMFTMTAISPPAREISR